MNTKQQTGCTDAGQAHAAPSASGKGEGGSFDVSLVAALELAEASLCHAYHTADGPFADHCRTDELRLAQINARLPELIAATRFAIQDAWPGAAKRLRAAWLAVGVEL